MSRAMINVYAGELDRTFFVWTEKRERERERNISGAIKVNVSERVVYLGWRIYKCRAVKRMLTRPMLPSLLSRAYTRAPYSRTASTLTKIPVVVRRDRSKSKDIWKKNKSQVSTLVVVQTWDTSLSFFPFPRSFFPSPFAPPP